MSRQKPSKEELKARLMGQTGLGKVTPDPTPEPEPIEPLPALSLEVPPVEDPTPADSLPVEPPMEGEIVPALPPPKNEPAPEIPEPVKRSVLGEAMKETRVGMRSDANRKQKAFVLERSVAQDIEDFAQIVGIHESRLVNSILKAAMDAGMALDEFKPHLSRMRAVRALLEEQTTN